MRTAYLGLATTKELISWTPERPNTCQFLLRRALRRSNSFVFWSVLAEDVSHSVSQLLLRGERASALRVVGMLSDEMGCVLPESLEEQTFNADRPSKFRQVPGR